MKDHPAARETRNDSDRKPGKLGSAPGRMIGKLRADDDMLDTES